jgi:hypothetical protein
VAAESGEKAVDSAVAKTVGAPEAMGAIYYDHTDGADGSIVAGDILVGVGTSQPFDRSLLMLPTIQRLYALALYLLRELIRVISRGQFFEYRVRVIITVAETSLVEAAALTICVVTGHPMALLRPTGMFVGLFCAVGLVLYRANDEAERRLLPRFEQDFARLTTANRIIGTIIVLLVIAFMFAWAIEATFVARGL